MKVNVNWFSHENIHGFSERSFQNNGKKHERSSANIFIVKKQKQNSNEFSNLLIEEFKGLRVNTAVSKVSENFERNSMKSELNNPHLSISADELKAVHFLNEYWA